MVVVVAVVNKLIMRIKNLKKDLGSEESREELAPVITLLRSISSVTAVVRFILTSET